MDSRINKTAFFNFPDMFHILKSPLNLKRARSYKVHYIALLILRTKTKTKLNE